MCKMEAKIYKVYLHLILKKRFPLLPILHVYTCTCLIQLEIIYNKELKCLDIEWLNCPNKI